MCARPRSERSLEDQINSSLTAGEHKTGKEKNFREQAELEEKSKGFTL